MELHLTITTNDIFGILHVKSMKQVRDLRNFRNKYFRVITLGPKFTGVKALNVQLNFGVVLVYQLKLNIVV